MRYPALILGAVAVQLLAVYLSPGSFDLQRRVLIVSAYIIGLVYVFFNRKHRWVLVVGLGLSLNLLVISANGGLMPVTPQAVDRAGLAAMVSKVELDQAIPQSKDVLMSPGSARLAVLSDTVVLPHRLGKQRVASPGDVFAVVGLAIGGVGASARAAIAIGRTWRAKPGLLPRRSRASLPTRVRRDRSIGNAGGV